MPLDGSWQFHLGDDLAWASPSTPDAAGTSGWEQIDAGDTWGAQGHPSYVGYAWYRKHIHLSAASGASPDFDLLLQQVDDVYEIYWNGALVARSGLLPPKPSFTCSEQPARIYPLGKIQDGVLAFRIWKQPLLSFQNDRLGGFHAPPVIGSPAAIAAYKINLDYQWLRRQQNVFRLASLNALLTCLSLLAWFRNRSQRLLLWMAVYSGMPLVVFLLDGMRLPWDYNLSLGLMQPTLCAADLGLWFVLLYLLKLNENPGLARLTRIMAWIGMIASSLDGILVNFDWANPRLTTSLQVGDGILTAVFTLIELYPFVMIALAMRKKLDAVRWTVAIAAFLTKLLAEVHIAVKQGSRFTHWTLDQAIGAPLFHINGSPVTAQMIANVILLVSIVYAVYRFTRESAVRQGQLEQELNSARELQQVLIPTTLPQLRGFTITSAYRPAREVGGDFFQILPLDDRPDAPTLVVLGDVSGKGLKAAMTVSLIVGTVRTLARFTTGPADFLTSLNQHLSGRLDGGFVTCLALWIDADGHCTLASAGHPGPYLNHRAVELPGALPLGMLPSAQYTEEFLTLQPNDHLVLYTDGLLEARGSNGELFSFERLESLIARRPQASEATQVAVDFGQDDDITVLTLTRLSSTPRRESELDTPAFASA